MSMEKYQPSPEEMVKIEKERVLSDAEFLKGGAEYKFNEKGEKRLEVTEEQIEKARKEMEESIKDKDVFEETEKELKSNLTKEFWKHHQKFGEELKEKYNYTDEMCARKFVEKDLRQLFYDFGFKELTKPHYKDEKGDKNSDITFEIDTLNKGTFEVDLRLKGPEIVIKLETELPMEELTLPKELKKIFNYLKGKGNFISPIFLVGKDEIRSFESSDIPPELPLSGKRISDEKWREINRREVLMKSSMVGYFKEAQEELLKRFWDWPRVGAKGLRTKHGMINGAMLYCDEHMAVFDAPQGKIEIPFSELLDPFGNVYGERAKKREEQRNQEGSLKNK